MMKRKKEEDTAMDKGRERRKSRTINYTSKKG